MGGPMTLAALIEQGLRVVAFCHGCGREGQIDLPALLQSFGPDFRPGASIKRFSAALRCTKCGWRGGRVEFRQPTRNTWGGAHRWHT